MPILPILYVCKKPDYSKSCQIRKYVMFLFIGFFRVVVGPGQCIPLHGKGSWTTHNKQGRRCDECCFVEVMRSRNAALTLPRRFVEPNKEITCTTDKVVFLNTVEFEVWLLWWEQLCGKLFYRWPTPVTYFHIKVTRIDKSDSLLKQNSKQIYSANFGVICLEIKGDCTIMNCLLLALWSSSLF